MTANAEPQSNSVIARIIEELNANPELKPVLLRAMLSEEFLLLPEKTDRLADLYAEMTNKVDRLADLYDALAAKIDALAARVDQLAEQHSNLVERVDQLTVTMEKLTGTVTALVLKVDTLDTNQKLMNGQLGNLLGEKYERRIARSIRSKAHSDLDIRRARVLQGETTTDYDTLLDAAHEARMAGTVTKEQSDSLERADFVLYGTDINTRRPRAAAVEVSVTLDRRDIERAAERAGILAQVLDCPAAAAVIGDTISELDRKRAATANVEVLIIAE